MQLFENIILASIGFGALVLGLAAVGEASKNKARICAEKTDPYKCVAKLPKQ
jgi:hypothetical protein